jgi:hypothetical protein
LTSSHCVDKSDGLQDLTAVLQRLNRGDEKWMCRIVTLVWLQTLY